MRRWRLRAAQISFWLAALPILWLRIAVQHGVSGAACRAIPLHQLNPAKQASENSEHLP